MVNITRMMRSRKGKLTIAAVLLGVAAIAVALYFMLRKRKDGFQNIVFKPRIPDGNVASGWRCPKGWRDTGAQSPDMKQCAYMRYKPKDGGKCPDGYVSSGKSDPKMACRHARRGEGEAKKFQVHLLKKDGQKCSKDTQCDSLWCSGSRCKRRGSVNDWNACSEGGECKSGNCDGNKKICIPSGGSPAPAPAPGPAGGKSIGMGCQDDGECSSNVCYDYRCTDAYTASKGGKFCRNDNWCTSKKCINGKCEKGPQDDDDDVGSSTWY